MLGSIVVKAPPPPPQQQQQKQKKKQVAAFTPAPRLCVRQRLGTFRWVLDMHRWNTFV